MGDVIETVATVVVAGLLVYGAYRVGALVDDRMTPEQRKEREREEWRHQR